MSQNIKVKVAAVQAAPVYMNLDASVEKACKFINEAAEQGAKLVAFPQAFLPGYPWWIWIDNPIAGIMNDKLLFENAVTVPGPAIQKLSQCARENDIYVCISGTEREGNSMYLTQFWFDNEGNLIGKHRKMKPTLTERTIWGEGDGSMMQVFDTPIGKLGGLESREHLNPMNMIALAAQGEQIHVASWPALPDETETLMTLMPSETATKHICASNGVFALFCTQVFNKQEVVDVCCKENPELINKLAFNKEKNMSGGHSCIYNSIAIPISNKLPDDVEGIVTADLDLSEIIITKILVDSVGHYAKASSVNMVFNRTPEKAVRIVGEEKDYSISYDDIQEC